MIRKATVVLGSLSAVYVAAVTAYLYFDDPFIKRDKTLAKLLDRVDRLV